MLATARIYRSDDVMIRAEPAIRRLLYISPRFPSISMTFEQNEILGLLGVGVDIQVLSCRWPSRSGNHLHEFARPIVDVTEYPRLLAGATGLLHALLHRPRALMGMLASLATGARNPLALPRTFGAFWFALGWYRRWAEPPDWIHADFGQNSATAAMFLGRLMERPFSFKVHAFDIFDERPYFRDPLRAEKVDRAAIVFSEHQFGRNRLAQLVEGSEQKVRVNYSSVRVGEFQPLPPPPHGNRRFVALGRLAAKKGFQFLVEAAAILRAQGHDLRIDIFGGGPEERNLRALIASRGVKDIVHLMGPYDNGRLPDILRDCLSLVMPSVITATHDMDGVPTVIYEAMALGRPVIASALSGIPEVVRDGANGLLVTPGDPHSLARAMAQLLEGPLCAEAMGHVGREAVERGHDHRAVAAELLRDMAGAVSEVEGAW